MTFSGHAGWEPRREKLSVAKDSKSQGSAKVCEDPVNEEFTITPSWNKKRRRGEARKFGVIHRGGQGPRWASLLWTSVSRTYYPRIHYVLGHLALLGSNRKQETVSKKGETRRKKKVAA